jgi:hypothetical protein
MANPIIKVRREDLFKYFTEQVVKTFHEKRESKALDGEEGRVIRGRSPSSSSDLEDLLAITISKILDSSFRFLVDKAISFKTPEMARAKTIYPDIMIIRDDVLVGIIELKIDLGYLKMDWIEKYMETQNMLAQLPEISYKYSNAENMDERIVLKIGEHLLAKSKIVVLTEGNAHGKLKTFVEATDAIVLYKNKPRDKSYNRANRDELIEKLVKEKDGGWKALETFLSKI